MNIKLQEVHITPSQYFQIIISNHFSRMWWFYFLAPLFIAYTFFLSRSETSIMVSFMMIIYPILTVIYLWRYSRNKQNRIFFKKKNISLEDEFLKAVVEDGSTDVLRWENIIKVGEKKKFILLYISKAQFIALPKTAFVSSDDISELLEFLSKREIKQ